MLTFSDYHREKMKDPNFKREYDALEGWYQEELARQEALDRAEEEKRHRASAPPTAPRSTFA
jgi:toxin-antitoxin system, antitoxin component, xre family